MSIISLRILLSNRSGISSDITITSSSSNIISSKIISNATDKETDIPFNLSNLPITTDSSYGTLAEFVNGIPFTVNKTMDNTREYHVNLYPLIKEIDSGSGHNILPILGKVLNFIDVDKEIYKFGNDNPSS